MSRTTILVLAVAILFLVGVGMALYHLNDAGTREVVNQYRGAVFSFTYPLGLEIEEYSNGALSIGSTTSVGYVASVNLALATPGDVPAEGTAQTELPPFLSNLCAADSPSERVSCARAEREETITNKSGARAVMYHLALTRERSGSEPEHLTYGPIYVYITDRIDPESEIDHGVLVVSNPLQAVLAGTADTALLERINDSVVIVSNKR